MSRTLSPLTPPPPREVSLHLWPSGEERQPPNWKLWRDALLRRRKVAALVFAGTLLGLLALLLFLPPSYRATATLQVNTSSASYSPENELPVIADLTGANQSRSLVTQTEILNNEAVRERALSMLTSSQRAHVSQHSVSVKSVPETDLIQVTGVSRDPRAASAISNALCAAYVDLSRDKNRAQYGGARRYVEQQLEATRARLNRAREAVRAYKQQQGTVDLSTETTNQISELARIESERRQARASREAAQAQLNGIRASLARQQRTVITPGTIVRRPAVLAIQNRLSELELRRAEALQEYVATAPQIKSLEAEIASLRAELRAESQTEVQSWQQSPNPVRQEAEQTVPRLQSEIWSLEARGAALKTLATRLQTELKRLPAREQQLGALTTEVSGLQRSYDALNQKYQTLRASEAARVASGSLLFPAQTPTTPTRRLTPVAFVLCAMLALLLALSTAAVAERLDERVRSPRDLLQAASSPVLAQVPALHGTETPTLLDATTMVSPRLENFRALRTMLSLTASKNGASRSLAVTSSLPNEGKSTVSVNLAVAAALGGERVILVDCDLRRPALHRLCGLNNEVGFVNVADGDATLESALQTTRVPGLSVLTSGPVSPNPFRALNSRGGRDLLRRLSEMADFVVIDTPPVLVLADARVTATLADDVLLVVSTREPEREEVALAGELLEQSGAKPVGLVLNKVASGPDFRDYHSRYPYYTGSFTYNANGGANGTKGHGNGAALNAPRGARDE